MGKLYSLWLRVRSGEWGRCTQECVRHEEGGTLSHTALLSRLQELVSWTPGRQIRLIRNIHRDNQTELRGFHHAGEVPVVAIFVRGLVVVLVVVLRENLFAIIVRFAVELAAERDGECRHAGMCEREMVGPVIVALFGMRVGFDNNVHAPRG